MEKKLPMLEGAMKMLFFSLTALFLSSCIHPICPGNMDSASFGNGDTLRVGYFTYTRHGLYFRHFGWVVKENDSLFYYDENWKKQ